MYAVAIKGVVKEIGLGMKNIHGLPSFGVEKRSNVYHAVVKDERKIEKGSIIQNNVYR